MNVSTLSYFVISHLGLEEEERSEDERREGKRKKKYDSIMFIKIKNNLCKDIFTLSVGGSM